jgi:hypothetical protein
MDNTLDETNSIKLHDKLYTKEEILSSEELKKEYVKLLRYQTKLRYQREYNKVYIEKNKEKVKEYAKNYMRNRYHEDPIFREKVLSRKRVKPENKKSMGRPLKYTIDENLNLTIIKKSI